jgi:hypothetical protein
LVKLTSSPAEGSGWAFVVLMPTCAYKALPISNRIAIARDDFFMLLCFGKNYDRKY